MNLDIARELKAIRVRKDLRMEDVANKLDISLETLRRYEKDASNIAIKTLEKILDHYEVNRYIFFKTMCEYNHDIKEV